MTGPMKAQIRKKAAVAVAPTTPADVTKPEASGQQGQGDSEGPKKSLSPKDPARWPGTTPVLTRQRGTGPICPDCKSDAKILRPVNPKHPFDDRQYCKCQNPKCGRTFKAAPPWPARPKA